MPTVAELSAKITANTTDFERGIKRANAELKDFSATASVAGGGVSQFARVGTAALLGFGVAAGGALAVIGKAIIDVGVPYERAMNMFQAVTGSTAETMRMAAQVAKELGADMSLPATSAGQAAAAMTELAKGGFTAQQAMDAARGTIMLAKAAMIEEAQAAGIVANAINSFGLAASEAGRVSDLLAAAANASSAEITDIALSMQQSAASAAALKMPIDDLVTAIGLMANAGIKGSDAGTSLKTMMARLIPETEKAGKAMEKLGIDAFDSKGQFIGLEAVIKQAAPALAKLTDEQKQQAIQAAFGSDAQRAANIILGAGVLKFQDMEKAVNRSNAAQELAASRAKGLGGAIDGLTSQLETIAIEIYEKVAPGVEKAVRLVADAISRWATDAKGFYESHKADLDSLGQKAQQVYNDYIKQIQITAASVSQALGEIKASIDKFSTSNDGSWKLIMAAVGAAADMITVQLRALSGFIRAFVDQARFAWAVLYDIFIEPIQKALNWIKGKAGEFEAAFSAITTAAKIGLIVKSPPQAAKWLMEIGAAAESEAKRLKASGSKWKEGFDAITAYAREAGFELTVKIWNSVNESVKQSLIKQRDEFEKHKTEMGIIWAGIAAQPEKAIPILKRLADAYKATRDVIVIESTAISASLNIARDSFELLQDSSAALTALMVADADKRRARVNASTQAIADDFHFLADTFKDLGNQLPTSWNRVIDGVLTASGRLGEEFVKLGIKVKGWARDIVGVIDTLPGKFGDAARGVLRTVDTWVAFADKVLALLNRFSKSIPASVEDAIGKMVSIFKGGMQSVTTLTGDAAKKVNEALDQMGYGAAKATGDLSSGINKAGAGVQAGASKIVGGLAQIAGAVLAFTGAKGAGFVGGAFQGALGGLAAAGGIATALGVALSPLTLGLSAVGGALLGGLIGLFTGGKSEQQKQQEKLQLEKMKLDVQQTAQSVVNAAIQGFQAALVFFESLDQFTAPRKAKFQDFWKAMTRLMDGFVALAKTWANENLERSKAVAEAIGAVAQALAQAPGAFNAINNSFSIPDSSFEIFFSNLDKFMSRFFARADVWIEGMAKRASKVAKRLSDVVGLISPFSEGVKSIVGLQAPADADFSVWERTLDRMIQSIGAIAERFDKGWLKTLAFFAEKSEAALGLWKTATDAIRATVDVPVVSEADIARVVDGMTSFIEKLVAASQEMTNEGLAKASSIANAILPIAAAVKAWSEAALLIKDYSGVANETWDKIIGDFNRTIGLINFMLASAIDFVPKAEQFEAVMKQIADHLRAGLDSLGNGLAAAASAFGGVVGLIQGGPTAPITGGDTLAGSSYAASSFAGQGLATGGASSSQAAPVVVNLNVNGNVIHQQELSRVFLQALMELYQGGRLNGGVIAGT